MSLVEQFFEYKAKEHRRRFLPRDGKDGDHQDRDSGDLDGMRKRLAKLEVLS